MDQWKKYGVLAALATMGVSVGRGWAAADPVAAPSPAVPVDTPTAPTRPQTPDEKALQAYLDTVQGQMAAAVTAGHAEDYQTALDAIAPTACRFYSIDGKSVSRAQYLNVERAAITAQGAGLTETARTQSLTITGPTALANTVVTEDQDVTDATGQFGPKGRRHHWQRLTFFRIHLADAPVKKAAARHVSADGFRPNDWKAQQVVVTDIQTFFGRQSLSPTCPQQSQARHKVEDHDAPRENAEAAPIPCAALHCGRPRYGHPPLTARRRRTKSVITSVISGRGSELASMPRW